MENQTILEQSEVDKIKQTTPFIKQGQLQTADTVREEKILANL